MIHRKIFSKIICLSIAALIAIPITLFATESIPVPDLKADVVMQGEKFSGNHLNSFAGYNTPESRYSIRHASIGASGIINPYVDYEITAGSATCLAGGQFTLMDASVFFHPIDHFKIGFNKGEVLRGFSFTGECTNQLTAEKTRFSKTFAPCHPTGALFEYENYGVLVQGALLNGEATQALEKEYDANLGIIYQTPLKGFALGGYYNLIKKRYGPDINQIISSDPGTRMGFGAKYEKRRVFLRSEFYYLKGYYNNPYSGSLYENSSDHSTFIQSKDREMTAFYAEGGYTFIVNSNLLYSIQPYTRFQMWNKSLNADGNHDYSFITCGLTFSLDQTNSSLIRVDYEAPLSWPGDSEKDAELLVIRFQTAFDFIE